MKGRQVIRQYKAGERRFSRATLRSANLVGAILRNIDLSFANLEKADLRSANLSGANLTGCDLTEADLRDANLNDANLVGANLYQADVTREQLTQARSIKGAIMPLISPIPPGILCLFRRLDRLTRAKAIAPHAEHTAIQKCHPTVARAHFDILCRAMGHALAAAHAGLVGIKPLESQRRDNQLWLQIALQDRDSVFRQPQYRLELGPERLVT
jgi:hypothetical protein